MQAKKLKHVFAAIAVGLAIMPMAAYSWDGVATGTLGNIDVTQAGNYPFRVSFASGANMCGSVKWSYLSDQDGNYKTYAGALLTAKALGKAVTFYTTRDANGFCQIGYISMQ